MYVLCMRSKSDDKSFQKQFAGLRGLQYKTPIQNTRRLGGGYIPTPDLRLLTFATAKYGSNTQISHSKALFFEF